MTFYSQSVELPEFSLTDIPFEITLENIPDTLGSITILFTESGSKESLKCIFDRGERNAKFSLEYSGRYSFYSPELPTIKGEFRVIPGWLSIVPPLLAILLALLIRQVIISLALGILAGTFFIYDYNPLYALLRFADTFIVNALADKDHVFIVLFTLLIGGVVGVISANGGTNGLAKQITRFAKNDRGGMLSSWLMGLVVFFDDYANSLIIGNMMRPITDKLRISREKLSYIVDSTAAPIASVVLISTWIGYELGIIEDGLRAVNIAENPYDVFIASIPYSFYPICAIGFVFLVSFTRRDFGPMLRAEKRARETGQVSRVTAEVKELKDDSARLYNGNKARWYNGAVPILIILFGTMGGLVYTGIESLGAKGIVDYNIQDIIGASDSYSSLLWGSFLACVVAVIMSVWQRILSLGKAMEAWQKGVQSMVIAVTILVFAWSISAITKELYTADYIISVLSDSIDSRFLPAIIFIICAVIGFSTGTSWGTMAIVMPIVIPLTVKLNGGSMVSPEEAKVILYASISSVLAGSVFGDHCSPIADTTILSSLASKCNHIDHVNTQLPYAITVGITCLLFGYLPVAYGVSPIISIVVTLGVLTMILILLGKKLPKVKED